MRMLIHVAIGLAILAGLVLALVVWARVTASPIPGMSLLFGQADETQIAFADFDLPDSPNWFLVCHPGLCGDRSGERVMASPIFRAQPNELAAALAEIALNEANTVRIREDRGGLYQDFVQRSALMAFPDTISVEIISVGPDSVALALFSRSRYGYSDLGVNETRARRWLAALMDRVPSESPTP